MKTRNTLFALAAVGTIAITTSTFAGNDEIKTNSTIYRGVTATEMTTSAPTGSGSAFTKLTKSQRADLRASIRGNLDTIATNWKEFHTDDGYLRSYIRTNLTKAEKKQFSADLKKFRDSSRTAYNTKLKELKTQYSDIAPDLTTIKADIYTTIDTQMSGLKTVVTPYLATDKMDAFNKFITDRAATMKTNADLRLQNIESHLLLKKSHK